MKHSKTDCRSLDGITVGLIDSLISISRVLREKLKIYYDDAEKRYHNNNGYDLRFTEPVIEALKDLHQDEDLLTILQTGHFNPNILSKDDQKMMDTLRNVSKLILDKPQTT